VFISSLTHSGSTLLDLILGGHSRFIGLGEIARVIMDGPTGLEQTRQLICSCGNKMNECHYWGKVASHLQSDNNLSFIERYKTVLETFDDVFGPDYIPVDSSKAIDHLRHLKTCLKLKIKVLYVVRDVRSYTISQIDNIKRKEEYRKREYIHRSPYFIFWRWYLGNKRMRHFFTEHNMEVLQIGYEELCLHPYLMAEKICDFLGEKTEPGMVNVNDSRSHVIRGNRMRRQTDKLNIKYDHRWFVRQEWKMPAALFPNIMKYNAKHVYSNKTEAIWEQ